MDEKVSKERRSVYLAIMKPMPVPPPVTIAIFPFTLKSVLMSRLSMGFWGRKLQMELTEADGKRLCTPHTKA